MAGHKVQRGPNTWRLHAYVGVDSKGKRRYTTTTVHGTKKEADRALAAFVTETGRDRNATAAAEPQSVSHVLNQWLESKESRLSPVTASRYRVAFKHIEPVLGSMPVTRLRPHHIEDLYASLHAIFALLLAIGGGVAIEAIIWGPGHGECRRLHHR